MADNKILDSDSLIAVREFVNNKIDEKIAESGGSGSGYKEFLRIKKGKFFTIADSDKFYCATQYKGGKLSHQLTNKYRDIKVTQKALFGTYSRNHYHDFEIQLTHDTDNKLNVDFMKNTVTEALGLGEFNVQWATPQQCWENWGRSFVEWGLTYDLIMQGNNAVLDWPQNFRPIANREESMPQAFWSYLHGQCFKLPYPENWLAHFAKSGDDLGMRKNQRQNRISIKFYKENAEGKKIISKYQLIVHIKAIRENWTEDPNISDGSVEPQYIVGYICPAIVRTFDFQDAYRNYIMYSN